MDTPLSLQTIVVATPEQVSCALGDESAILNLKNCVYYGTNPTGSTIWNWLQQPKTIEEIRNKLLNEYEVEPERCERDLLALLETMRAEGLIEVSSVAAT